MIELSTFFSEEEKEVLKKYTGGDYEILTQVEGESYVLCDLGEFFYNQCFTPTETPSFKNQKYRLEIPHRILKVWHFYLMETTNKGNIWYRGRKDNNGNWEYDSYSDSLEEALDTL